MTRIDVTVDFPDLLVDSFLFLPQQGATSRQWRVDGKLQTFTLGKPQGNQTAIYDRKAKRIANGKSWQGKEGTRIERRIKQPKINMLPKLPFLPNPFSAMNMVGMPTEPPADQKTMSYVWDLFRRAVEVEGLPGALALLPEERRTQYRKHLDAHQQSWWDPAAIWAGWPKMLEILQIGSKQPFGL